jgi:hypothetical protein
MKQIKDLYFGFNDAENYKRPENKALFDKYFYRTNEFTDIFKPSTSFIIGEKGTGKTAYATYVTNNFTFNTNGFLNFIRETDYQKFIKLKTDNHLQLSDYQNVWKVLIYLLLSDRIRTKETEDKLFKSSANFDALQKAIDEYYVNAFSPEIIHALNFVEKTKYSAELVSKYFNAIGESVKEGSFTHSKFQTNLLYIQNHFEKAIGSLKLKQNYILFIDGIDIRPENIPYNEYLDCVKGLANAVWSLNNDFFPTLKSDGKLKIILLIRPDIFSNLGLQNQNNKIKDNSILLDWKTNYSDFVSSKLFLLADRLLLAQQDRNYPASKCWENYFPYTPFVAGKRESSFIQFLRFSFYRPRDIVTILDLLKEVHTRDSDSNTFTESDFNNSELQTRYSDYLMGEIKDYLSFYYSDSDYELFRKFFDFLEGRKEFDYKMYNSAFKNFEEYINKNNIERPKFFETADTFLQFIYDLNIICYIEHASDQKYIRWCFRERNYSNISPKVKAECSYQIHYGLIKNLNLGKQINNSKTKLKSKTKTKPKVSISKTKMVLIKKCDKKTNA